MRPVPAIVVIIIFCSLMIMPVPADVTTSPDHYIIRSYNYVLDGRQGTLTLALSTEVYKKYLGMEPQYENRDNTSYFLSFVNDPAQAPYIRALADEIRVASADPDDQARIATNLVQHITYNKGNNTRYPYEVLYEGQGVCGEKSILLTALLRELGFRSSVMYFMPENHMTAGIGCEAPYEFQGTGYCMIESTVPSIITDETSFPDFNTAGWSSPEVTGVSEGRSFDTASHDYYDARAVILLKAENADAHKAGESLRTKDYVRWYLLKNKYDLF